MRLSRAAAEAAIEAEVARPLGIDVTAAAAGIRAAVDARMATVIRLHTIERGGDPQRFTLFAFGGAGPVHAYELARRVGMGRVICPPCAGVASAIGLAVAPPTAEAARSHHLRLGRDDAGAIGSLLAELEAEARAQLAHLGTDAPVDVRRVAELCYVGQGHRIAVAVPGWGDRFSDRLRVAFEDGYRRTYGRDLGARPVEALTWRVTVSIRGAIDLDLRLPASRPGMASKGRRPAFFGEAAHALDCLVLDRERLAPGESFAGPVIVEERESTTVVGPSGRLRVDQHLNLVVDIVAATAASGERGAAP